MQNAKIKFDDKIKILLPL